MIIASRETIKKLHRRPGVLLQVHRPRAIQAYDPDEPRDNHGRWSEEGGTTNDEVIERKPVGSLSQDPSTFLSNKSEGERERILRSNNITDGYLNIPSKDMLREFEQKFKMDIVQFKLALTKGLNFETNMVLIRNNYIELRGVNDEFNMWRTWNLDSHSVKHDALRVADKGKGLGKVLLNNSLDLYDHIGIKTISLCTSSIGGYAWARFGFVPTQSEWNSLRQSYSGQDQHVKEFCKSVDPKAIRGLAAISAGKEFLLGKSWLGTLDLTDKDSYTVSRKYCVSKGEGKK